jgi:hypothetical protein
LLSLIDAEKKANDFAESKKLPIPLVTSPFVYNTDSNEVFFFDSIIDKKWCYTPGQPLVHKGFTKDGIEVVMYDFMIKQGNPPIRIFVNRNTGAVGICEDDNSNGGDDSIYVNSWTEFNKIVPDSIFDDNGYIKRLNPE